MNFLNQVSYFSIKQIPTTVTRLDYLFLLDGKYILGIKTGTAYKKICRYVHKAMTIIIIIIITIIIMIIIIIII